MKPTIEILGTEIELTSDQFDSIKSGLLNTNSSDLANEFANVIIKLQATGKNVSDLLWRTIGTLWKLYDSEEENMVIVEDTTKWVNWEADFMD